MAVRVHQLAKDLGIQSNMLLKKAQNLGMALSNHMNSLTPEQVTQLKQAVGVLPGPKEPAAAKPTKPRKAAVKRKRKTRAKAKKPADQPEKPKEPEKPKPAKATASSRAAQQAPSTPRARPPVESSPPTRRGLGPQPVSGAGTGPPSVLWTPPTAQDRYRRPRRRPRRRPMSGVRRVRPMPKQGKVQVDAPVTVKQLSAALGVKAAAIIAGLMRQDIMATITDVLSAETASLVAVDFDVELEVRERVDLEQEFAVAASKPEDLVPRAPIVAFLGHVDHGKTSLLDAIRKTNVAEGEAGGITQHIGAYKLDVGGRSVVFLDTPGHEAFTAMRARGANVTDVVVLVVAADDGVMPQTEEAVDHARAADVPIVVAINKIDLPNANVPRVKQQLAALQLQPEEWGGETVCVEVSAVTGKGIEDLLEMLALVAELRELKADPARLAHGTALDAKLTGTRGVVAAVLVQEGVLRKGDELVCGTATGRVRAILNDRGLSIPEAGPATPCEILGLSTVPDAGDPFQVVEDAHRARHLALQRRHRIRLESLTARRHVTLENLYDTLAAAVVKELRLILKADVKGSLEAMLGVLNELATDEVKPRILRSGVGGISVSDVLLADASDAVVVGLHVSAEPAARELAEGKQVEIRLYSVIYRVKEDIRAALEGMLEPEEREVITGHAQVRQSFRLSRAGMVAGSYVTDGVLTRGQMARVIRDEIVIHQGRLESIRRVKDDVREVREGFECGLNISGYEDVKVEDRLEGYRIEKIARTLDQAASRPAAKTDGP